jgi:uncharacterized protein (DUF2236 family)
LLAGLQALLLKIAHPKIAQGVADHSRYGEDPPGRGIRTFNAVYSLVFGDRDEAIEAAMRVRFVHVHGQVMGPLTGTRYTRLLAPFNYSMATLLLPVRLVDGSGMRRNRVHA